MKKISLIIGSTRQNRIGKSVADWYVAVAKDAGVDLRVLDLAEVNLPKFDAPVPPAYMPTQSDAGKVWQAMVAESEAFVFVTPEYNRSIPASLKDAIDYLFAEWSGKPATTVSYGYVDGGASVTAHLKDVLGWVKIDLRGDSVNIKLSQETFDENGSFKDIEALLAPTKEKFVQNLKALQA